MAVAHDLRTPIAIIRGLAGLTRSRWDRLPEATKRENLEIIERQTELLSRFVDDLVTGSRTVVPAGPGPQVVLVREHVAATLRGLGLERELSVHVPVALAVVADPAHLTRIIRTFVENARDHGAAPFSIDARERDGDVVIRVVDCGDGVRPDLVRRLFGRSDDMGERGTPVSSGTEPGLSIARRLARASGGDAWYEATSPRGACFAVALPGAGSS